jgi:hypothetical protein
MKWLMFGLGWMVLGVFFGGCAVNKVRDWTAPSPATTWGSRSDTLPADGWQDGFTSVGGEYGGIGGLGGGVPGMRSEDIARRGGLAGIGGAYGMAGGPPNFDPGAGSDDLEGSWRQESPVPRPTSANWKPTETDSRWWVPPVLAAALTVAVMAAWNYRKKLRAALSKTADATDTGTS